MEKPLKPITQEKANKRRILLIMLFNFYFGAIILSLSDFIIEYLQTGLYHKIIVFLGTNIPLGIIIGIITVSFVTFILYLIIKIDYLVYTKGIQIIKIEGEIKTE